MDSGCCCTVTWKVAVRLEPSAAVALIIAVPLPTPVTTPFSSTVAAFSLPLDQVTALMEAFSGEYVTLRGSVPPMMVVFCAAVICILVTGCTTSR